jgi:hypothetical protein
MSEKIERAEFWLHCLELAYRHGLGQARADGTQDGTTVARFAVADTIFERALQGPPSKDLPKE